MVALALLINIGNMLNLLVCDLIDRYYFYNNPKLDYQKEALLSIDSIPDVTIKFFYYLTKAIIFSPCPK